MDADHLELVSDGGLVQSECVGHFYIWGADPSCLGPPQGFGSPGPAPWVRAEKENDSLLGDSHFTRLRSRRLDSLKKFLARLDRLRLPKRRAVAQK